MKDPEDQPSSKKITIRLPGNDFPYNNCVVKEGNPSDLSQKLVFTTVSKAGLNREITIHPNGAIVEQVLNADD